MKSDFEKWYRDKYQVTKQLYFFEDTQRYEDGFAQDAWEVWQHRQTEVDELNQELHLVLNNWNDLTKAIHARTNGTAVAEARQLYEKVDELQKRVDAVKGLAQTLWEKSNEKHKQGKVWESKTLGECADEILDELEQALKGGCDE